MTRSSSDTTKVTPAAFTDCRSIGESSDGLCGEELVGRTVVGDVVDAAHIGAGRGGNISGGIGLLADIADRGCILAGDIDDPARRGR